MKEEAPLGVMAPQVTDVAVSITSNSFYTLLDNNSSLLSLKMRYLRQTSHSLSKHVRVTNITCI